MRAARTVGRRVGQAGLTLVELLVAMVVVSLIVMTVLALYGTSAAAYRTTDGNQQLQDNARFITEVLSQAVRQAGLQDTAQYTWFSAQGQPVLAPAPVWDKASFGAQPALFGYDNAKVSSTNESDFGANGSGGPNGSDIFGVRYFGSSVTKDASKPDGSVIDCRGSGVAYPLGQGDIGLSLFVIAADATGELSLQCINAGRRQMWPLVSGVETFQVMYAVDTDPAADSTPNRWLHARQVQAANLWPRVRAVRFGFVLRGPPGSGVRMESSQRLYPLGESFSSAAGAAATDAEMAFAPAADGRLRRAFSFSIALRNVVDQ